MIREQQLGFPRLLFISDPTSVNGLTISAYGFRGLAVIIASELKTGMALRLEGQVFKFPFRVQSRRGADGRSNRYSGTSPAR